MFCPHCGTGRVNTERDAYGEFQSCLQCGYEKSLGGDIPLGKVGQEGRHGAAVLKGRISISVSSFSIGATAAAFNSARERDPFFGFKIGRPNNYYRHARR